MATLHAGGARVDITPQLGFPLVGYGNRLQGATAVHDRLWARALVLTDAHAALVLVSVEMCYLAMSTVAAVRLRIHRELGIPPEHVLIATTHTHAGPRDRDTGNWSRPLADLIADAIVVYADTALQWAREVQVACDYCTIMMRTDMMRTE